MRHRLLIWSLCLGLAAAPVWGAVTPNSPVTPQLANRGIVQLLPATTAIVIPSGAATLTGGAQAYACDVDGTKVKAVYFGSNDTSAQTGVVVLLNTSKPYVIAAVTVPITAGQVAGTPAVNALANVGLPLDSDGNPYFSCASGDTIWVGTLAAVTAAKVVTVLVVAEDF